MSRTYTQAEMRTALNSVAQYYNSVVFGDCRPTPFKRESEYVDQYDDLHSKIIGIILTHIEAVVEPSRAKSVKNIFDIAVRRSFRDLAEGINKQIEALEEEETCANCNVMVEVNKLLHSDYIEKRNKLSRK